MFKSDLSNRKFKALILIKNTFSEPGNYLSGVPPRYILGLFVFLLYINDVLQAANYELLLNRDNKSTS